jgi:glycosyltransferase involved in cell wall biosynthesis
MIIGIEGQRLFRKKKHGMDMVALELIRNLQTIDTVNQYYIYVAQDEDDTCLKETPNFKIRKISGGFYPFWEQIALPKAAKADGCQLLHCTSNTAPIFSKIPLMVTLHDIIYMEKSIANILNDKGTAYQKFGNVYRRIVVPRILQKSKIIVTVSNFEKDRIAEFFKIHDNRLRTVYNGVGKHFKKITDPSELKRVKDKYRLPDKFFFHLGNTDPKKNTRGVLQAYSAFLKSSGAQTPLVMLDYDRQELEKLTIEINDRNLINFIHLTGYVVNTDLPAIFSQCDLFLYPSLRESFGIPILEAMACGTPVITSNTSSMPEIAGDAAYITDPFKPEEITKAIHFLLNNPEKTKLIIENGFQQAAKFSWHAMALDIHKLYNEILK